MAISPALFLAKAAAGIAAHGETVSLEIFSDPSWDSSFGASQRTSSVVAASAVCYDEIEADSGGDPSLRSRRKRAIIAASISTAPRVGDLLTVRDVTSRISAVSTHEYRGTLIAYGLELED